MRRGAFQRGRRLALLALLAPGLLGAAYEWGGPAARGVRELQAGRNEAARSSLRDGHRDLPRSAALRFDEGLALARTGHADSAGADYREGLALRGERGRASAAYNLGNLAMNAKRYAEAAGWYREALRLAPHALDAKRTLEDAIRRLRGQEPPPPRGGGGGGGSPPPQQGRDSTRAPQGEGGGRQPPAQQPQKPGEQGKSPPPQAGPQGSFTREEAERWLEALERERREERHRAQGSPREERGDRDW